MAYDETLAARVRAVLGKRGMDFVEKKMFGGLCFLVEGHMCCGITDVMMVRVGKEAYLDALDEKGARPMTFTGRPMAGFVYVDPPGYRTEAQLGAWVDRGVRYLATLPRRVAKPARAGAKPKPRAKAKPGRVSSSR